MKGGKNAYTLSFLDNPFNLPWRDFYYHGRTDRKFYKAFGMVCAGDLNNFPNLFNRGLPKKDSGPY